MTKFINYTNDRIINRDLSELDRIDKMLEPYPDKVDYKNINLAHVMLKEEQNRLQGHVERGAFSTGHSNPQQGEQYSAGRLGYKKQPLIGKNNGDTTYNKLNRRLRKETQSKYSPRYPRSATITVGNTPGRVHVAGGNIVTIEVKNVRTFLLTGFDLELRTKYFDKEGKEIRALTSVVKRWSVELGGDMGGMGNNYSRRFQIDAGSFAEYYEHTLYIYPNTKMTSGEYYIMVNLGA